MNEVVIDAMQPGDWPAVEAIYREGIATGLATFETETPSWERWDAAHRPDCRLVVRAGERVLGWAALSPVSDRCVYAGVAENSIYIAAAARGQGIGKALLRASQRGGGRLDAANGHFSGERGQSGVAPGVRLSHSRYPRAHRAASRCLERRRVSGAAQPGRWDLTRVFTWSVWK